MSAGQPNWQALSDMGKLPKEHRDKVPLLSQLDSLEELLVQEKAKSQLMYSFLTPEQKKEYNMALKGEKPGKNQSEE